MRTWAVARVGYRVPRERFDGVVHGVFARACYIDCGGSLLTLATAGVSDGPTTLVLGADAPADLRYVFNPGDALRCREGCVRGPDVRLELAHARTWRAPPRRLGTTARVVALWFGADDDPELERADPFRHLITNARVDQPLSTV